MNALQGRTRKLGQVANDLHQVIDSMPQGPTRNALRDLADDLTTTQMMLVELAYPKDVKPEINTLTNLVRDNNGDWVPES